MNETRRNELKARLIQAVEERQEELIALCGNLIKINSENPEGDSTEITDFIVSYLKKHGFEPETFEPQEKRFNILARYGNPEGKTLIYCGHDDVVPHGNLENWDFDPCAGDVVDGFLRGRGASDMKAGLGGLIFALVLMKEMDIDLEGELLLAVVPDEETGGGAGVPWLLKEGVVRGDGCLIAEPSSEYNPTIGQKGSYWFELEVFGTPGHGSLSPIIGGNAIVDCIRAIERIRKLFEVRGEMTPEQEELIAVTKKYMREVETSKEPFQDIIDHISCNIGRIEGGRTPNMVAESCKVLIDCRLPLGVKEAWVTEYIERNLKELGLRYKLTRFGIRSEANYTSAEDPVCRAIIDNLAEISGHEAYGVQQWASSDARHFREYDIPVLQYGPAYLSTIHGYNERVETWKIVQAAKVYVAAAVDFLNGKY